jgi:ABC-type nickel/cobalt efflux system permease component RcnA
MNTDEHRLKNRGRLETLRFKHFFYLCSSVFICGLVSPQPVSAHPLVKSFYDRRAMVHLSADSADHVQVRVEYRLELNVNTALWDLRPFVKDLAESDLDSDPHRFAAFVRCYGPVLADKIYVRLDGRDLPLACVKNEKPELEKQKQDGQPSDSLICLFVFRASGQLEARERHTFTIEEGAYQEQPGAVLLSLFASAPITLGRVQMIPGDDGLPRTNKTTFTLAKPTTGSGREEIPPPEAINEPHSEESNASSSSNSLLDLLFDSQQGFALLLLLAAAFGAVHALTPGHGKTLVAAYLVGERGTILHALFLGLVTTLSHTGMVILLALGIRMFGLSTGEEMQLLIGVGGGLFCVAFGFWLLYRRLSGQADHFHLGGSHHHHHGDHHHHHGGSADHYHDERGHAHPLAPAATVGWGSLLLLGAAGGVVPCGDAILLLFFAISAGRMQLALPLLLAFSAGLAFVLVAVGMLVVASKRFAESRFGASGLFRALPVISAVLVMGAGLWLCYNAVNGGAAFK